jgi:hypothetical protein
VRQARNEPFEQKVRAAAVAGWWVVLTPHPLAGTQPPLGLDGQDGALYNGPVPPVGVADGWATSGLPPEGRCE